jgi:DNA-directed RNA polymerase subunit omega
MIYPSADKIDAQIDSKYALVILASKRAKQLKEGSRARIKTDSTNLLTVALEEIASGEIQYRFDEFSLAGREALADKQAVVGARELEVDIDLPDETELLRAAREALGAGDDESDKKIFGEDDEEGDSELADEEIEEEDPLQIADDETDPAAL